MQKLCCSWTSHPVTRAQYSYIRGNPKYTYVCSFVQELWLQDDRVVNRQKVLAGQVSFASLRGGQLCATRDVHVLDAAAVGRNADAQDEELVVENLDEVLGYHLSRFGRLRAGPYVVLGLQAELDSGNRLLLC